MTKIKLNIQKITKLFIITMLTFGLLLSSGGATIAFAIGEQTSGNSEAQYTTQPQPYKLSERDAV